MKTLGPNSVSSGLALTLKIAYVLVAVWAAGTVAGAVVSLLVFVLYTAQAHEPPAALKFLEVSWTVGLPALLYRLAVAIGALAVVRRLSALFHSFAANQPFASGNADHLRMIWVTLVVIEIVRSCAFVAARLLPTFYAAGDVPVPQEIASPIDFSRWFMIFVVLILAEVFRQGTRLREDSELTV
jgi:DUF2975 family protein